MKSRAARAIVAIAIAGPLLLVALYVANPHQAAGWDPRERIAGFGIYRMPSIAMEPALPKGTDFFVRAGHYRRHAPVRGEIAVYDQPPYGITVKRIVGLPGEAIAIEDGVVTIDGQALVEPYVVHPPMHAYSRDLAPVSIPPGHVFVMGDHRDNSEDSRFLGPVPVERLASRVVTE